MALAEAFSGNNTITSTEWSLTSNTSYDTGDAQTADGVYQVWLDLNDMVAGDQLRIRIYEKVRSADTQRIAYSAILAGPPPDPVWVSPSLIMLHGWDVSCTTLAGTSIVVNWSIRQAA